jgi:hypothetical protein
MATTHTPDSRYNRWLLTAAGCLCALGTAACSASADIPEVQVTQSDIAFDGVPLIPGVTDVSTTLETTFDHPQGLGLPDALDPKLYPISASVTARDDMKDLSFLEGLSLTLASHADGAPEPRKMATYARKGSGSVGKVIQLVTDNDTNVLDYWDTKKAYYDVKIWGVLPQEAWAIDVTVSFSGELSISTN